MAKEVMFVFGWPVSEQRDRITKTKGQDRRPVSKDEAEAEPDPVWQASDLAEEGEGRELEEEGEEEEEQADSAALYDTSVLDDPEEGGEEEETGKD